LPLGGCLQSYSAQQALDGAQFHNARDRPELQQAAGQKHKILDNDQRRDRRHDEAVAVDRGVTQRAQPRPATSQAVWITTSGALRPVSKWRGGRRTSTPEATHAIPFRPGYPNTPRACIDVALSLGAIAKSARDMTVGWLVANLGVADSNIPC
jgi:hypothetical protein